MEKKQSYKTPATADAGVAAELDYLIVGASGGEGEAGVIEDGEDYVF